NQLWYRRQTGSTWSNWISTGSGPVAGDPVAVSDGTGLHLFVRGTGGDIRYLKAVGGPFGAWTSLRGSAMSDPCVGSAPGGLFVCQRDIIGWRYVNQFSKGGWSGWTWLWGIVNADITAAVDAGGGVDVFIRADDNALWFRRYAGSWSGWARLDAFLTG